MPAPHPTARYPKFLGQQQRFRFNLTGSLGQTGRLRAKGLASFWEEQANFQLQLQRISAPLLDQAYSLPIKVKAGQVNANLQVKLQRRQPPDLRGIAEVKRVNMRVASVPQAFEQVTGYLRFRGLAVYLDGLVGDYSEIPLQARGWIDPNQGYSLAGESSWVTAPRALKTLQVSNLPFPVTGQIKGQNLQVIGPLNQPRLRGSILTAGQPSLDRVPFSRLSAQFQLADSVLKVMEIEGQPLVGGLFTGTAQLNLAEKGYLEVNLQSKYIPGNAIAQLYKADPGFVLGPVSGLITLRGPADDIRTTVKFEAPQSAFPTTGTVIVYRQIAQLQDILSQVPGGTLGIKGKIQDNLVQAFVTTTGVTLKAYAPENRGLMTGQLEIVGPFNAFSPKTARAKGNLRFSQGIALITQPINAQVNWDGRQIIVDSATAPGFWSRGVVGLDFATASGPQLTTLNLAVEAQQYALNHLPPLGPTQISLAGAADLSGTLRGQVSNPVLTSKLRIQRLGIGPVAFEPLLSGNLDYGPQAQLDLRLAGERDRIDLLLDRNSQPQSFDIRRDQAIAQGQMQAGDLQVAFQKVPLEIFNWQPIQVNGIGKLAGIASGQYRLQPSNWSGRGEIMIERPSLGSLVADNFRGLLSYQQGSFYLQQGELYQRQNEYRIEAKAILGNILQYSGTIQIKQAEIADLLAAAQSVNWGQAPLPPPSYGKAADVQTESVGSSNRPLLDQLRRLAELDQLRFQQTLSESPPLIPALEDLTGQIRGQLQFAGSSSTGVNSSFNLNSQNIKWGTYQLDQAQAIGEWRQDQLSLFPLKLTKGNQGLEFKGNLSRQEQSGALSFNNIPIAELNQFLDLPVQVAGLAQGTATLAGSWDNPRWQGNLALTEARLDQTILNQASTSFIYQQGRLAFEGKAASTPIEFLGNIPYPLPWSTVQPTSQAIDIRLKLRDEGLAVLNSLGDQLSWVKGQGTVDLQVGAP
ncbi:MAG: DUF748 domain-containing protein [Acaryochloridaceae cyanobacterium SU_2_1]|nr:DUF748 domain-containing protein [Acaryochloridaceae cyanobacterium SU_2_1]